VIADRARPFNGIALWTLIKREMIRSLKIINQVIWPPIISTLLYVFIFGVALGSRISSVQGVTYAQFLIPGLIMLQVIDSSYGECSSSIFQGRFMNSIQEMLIAPMSSFEIVFGYVLGSLARAYLIAALITALGVLLVHTWPANWGLDLLVLTMVSLLFSSLGLIFGLMAEKFDHLAVLTTFVITPLTFVGGVFTAASMLPPALRRLELFNPIFYTIDAFRRSYTGQSYLPIAVSVGAIAVLTIIALAVALRMTAIGYKLRT
jgi:ABC-2 type transport system permease protein